VPLELDVICIHDTLLVAVQVHPLCAETITVPFPLFDLKVLLVGDIEYVQLLGGGDAVVVVVGCTVVVAGSTVVVVGRTVVVGSTVVVVGRTVVVVGRKEVVVLAGVVVVVLAGAQLG
jgi:hypothetical protein